MTETPDGYGAAFFFFVAALQEKNGWTDEALSAVTGIPLDRLQSYLMGERPAPSIDEACSIAFALARRVDEKPQPGAARLQIVGRVPDALAREIFDLIGDPPTKV